MSSLGVLAIAGAKIERSEYGIAEAISPGCQLHLISESFSEMFENGVGVASGDIELRLAYGGGGLQNILATALFSHLDKSPVSLGNGLYRHYFELEQAGRSRNATGWDSSSPTGKTVYKRATVMIDRNYSIAEIVSFQPSNLSFDISKSPRLTIAGNGVRLNTNTEKTHAVPDFTYYPVPLVSLHHVNVRLIPLTRFNFTNDETLVLTESGSTAVTVTIPAGVYFAAELAREIEKQLNSSGSLNNRYKVSWLPDKRKFTLVSDGDFSIDVTGTISTEIGFLQNTAFSSVHVSDICAKPSGIIGDLTLNASSVSIVIDTGIERKSDYDGAWEQSEGYPSREPTVKITLNLNRVADNIKKVGELNLERFGVEISAINPGGVGKIYFYVPNAELKTNSAPVTGEQIIEQTISLEAQKDVFDPTGLFFDDAYMIRQLPSHPTAGVNFISAGKFHNVFIAADGVGGLYKLDGGNWVSIGSSGDPFSAFAEWDDVLYIADEGGLLWKYDGKTLTSIGSFAVTGIVKKLVVFNDKLYALHKTGSVSSFDGVNFTDESVTGATAGFDIISQAGNLYALLTVTTTKFYEYNGSTWTQIYDFGASFSTGSITPLFEHKSMLASADNNLIEYSTITNSAVTKTNAITVEKSINYGENAVFIDTSGNIYWYEYETETSWFLGNISTGYSYEPVIFDNKLIIPNGSANLPYLQFIFKLRLTIEDKTINNPYV